MRIEGKVAIVIGGARGIGFGIVEKLLQNGAKVCIADINEDLGKKSEGVLNEKFPDSVIFCACDIVKDESVRAVFDNVKSKFGTAEILVNTAAILNEEIWRKMIEINLVGTICSTYAAMEKMNPKNGGKGGVVVHTASISSFLGSKYHPVYVTSKHGVLGLTFSLGTPAHLERTGVRVNCICPTNVFTDLVHDMKTYFQEEYMYNKTHKFGSVTPEICADAVVKLIEDDSLNGDAMVVSKKKGTFLHDKSREDFYSTIP